MAAKSGRRYPLVIYTLMMDRWRPWIFWLGILLFILAVIVYFWGMEQWRWVTFGVIGAFNILFSILMWGVRKSAHVQLFPTYLRLVTPFLRINISYKRIRRSGPANMGATFPPKRVSSTQAEVVQQVAGMTAVVIEFNKPPMSQTALRFFLSPLFFKDKTPNLVLLVEDWMTFSAEMDSIRSGTASSAPQVTAPETAAREPQSAQPQKNRAVSNSILSKLPPKK